MPKDLTVKDVLYALEYMGDAMVRIPADAPLARWRLEKSGLPVRERIANEVRASGLVLGIEELGRQLIVWKAAA